VFEVSTTRRYRWDEMCDAAGYLRVLDTYSGHRSLGDDARERLFSGIADLFDMKFGGIIVKGLPDNPVRGPQEVEALSLQGRHRHTDNRDVSRNREIP
jgi:hypothetical protein